MPTFTNKPIFLWDNFYDLVYANPEGDWDDYHGTLEQVEGLSSGRRNRNPNPWSPGSSADRYIEVDLGSGNSKAANCVFLGRGHNYSGEDVTIQHSNDGSAWSSLVSNVTVDTDGETLEDGSWCYLFEGSEVSRRYWRVNFENVGSVSIQVPELWLGRMEQLSSYFDAPVDESSGIVWRVGEQTSDRGVKSAAAASSWIKTFNINIGLTDDTASEFANLIEPWLDHLKVGGFCLAALDWPNAGDKLAMYRLQGDTLGAPFRVRGKHTVQFTLEEVV